MEEHPIPQEVSTYEFRLVGDMTIKQFMQVAAGALIALVLYSSHIAPYVKWPLIIISFLSGIALAFFPIEDRPLSKWIVLFMKAIYSPTIYVWDKNARRYAFFQPEPVESPVAGVALQAASTTMTPGISSQSSTLTPSEQPDESDKLEKNEQEFLNKVSMQFTTPTAIKTDTVVAQAPTEQKHVAVPANVPTNVPAVQHEVSGTVQPEHPGSTVGGEITPIQTQQTANIKAATFSPEASPPSPPTRPNVVVGQVLASDGKIVDGAILEIKDSEGRPVRALRSNRLGHFMIVTPLVNGNYQITTEKDGFTFETVSFEAKDQIIPPIAIWAKT